MKRTSKIGVQIGGVVEENGRKGARSEVKGTPGEKGSSLMNDESPHLIGASCVRNL